MVTCYRIVHVPLCMSACVLSAASRRMSAVSRARSPSPRPPADPHVLTARRIRSLHLRFSASLADISPLAITNLQIHIYDQHLSVLQFVFLIVIYIMISHMLNGFVFNATRYNCFSQPFFFSLMRVSRIRIPLQKNLYQRL